MDYPYEKSHCIPWFRTLQFLLYVTEGYDHGVFEKDREEQFMTKKR